MNTSMKLGLIAVTALALVAGCAADADKEASSESEVTTRGRPDVATGAAVGELCGGIGGFQCAAGLECNISEELANVPDAAGKCERPLGGQGDACGRGQPRCAPTFICIIAPDDRSSHCEGTALGGN